MITQKQYDKIEAVLLHFLSIHEAAAVYGMIFSSETEDNPYTKEDILDYIRWCHDRYLQDEDTQFESWLAERGRLCTLYVFHGSLSVIQLLEDSEFEKTITEAFEASLGQEQILTMARERLKEKGVDWQYDLNLEMQDFEGKDNFEKEIDQYLDNFERWHNFEEEDLSGNAQGFTSFSRRAIAQNQE